MGLFEIIVLAIVQGLTEFLPVSSSGHLVVTAAILEAFGYPLPPEDELLAVEIVLHVGTLLAIFVFFWREVRQLLGPDRRLIVLLAIGTIPAVVIGLPLKHFASEWLTSPLLAGCLFPVTAALLIWAARQPEGTLSYRDVGYGAVITIGLLQSLALLPGVSRSGATIAGGLFCRLDRTSAGVFAFLLGIPAMAGAGAMEILDLVQQHMAATSQGAATMTTSPVDLLLGTVVAMLVGLLALRWLIRWVQQGRLGQFAWYLFPLAVVVLGWQLLVRITG